MRLWDNAAALRRLYRWLYVCVTLCLLWAGGAWLVNSPHFPIKQVEIVRPLQRVGGAQVAELARRHLQGNIFKADVNAARAAFARLPWVETVTVKRIWPDKVVVDITERVPVARWGQSELVSDAGVVFDAPSDEAFPLLVAENPEAARDQAPAMVVALMRFQAALKPIGLQVAELHYSERAAWQLVLDNGLRVRLGRQDEGETEQRLRHFVWAWTHVLREQAGNIEYVDMRYRDGFAVRRRARAEVAAAPATAAEAE